MAHRSVVIGVADHAFAVENILYVSVQGFGESAGLDLLRSCRKDDNISGLSRAFGELRGS
jgi:hypothetical protein